MLAQLQALYRDMVTIAPPGAPNSYGEQAPGVAVTYRARCVGQRRMVPAAGGQERISRVTVYLLGAPTTLSVQDTLTLPTRFSPRTPPILAIQHEPDERGNHHVVVYTE